MNTYTKSLLIAGSLAILPSISNACVISAVCGTPINLQTPGIGGCAKFSLLEDTNNPRIKYYLNKNDWTFQYTYPTLIAMAAGNIKIEFNNNTSDPNTNCNGAGIYIPSFWTMTVP